MEETIERITAEKETLTLELRAVTTANTNLRCDLATYQPSTPQRSPLNQDNENATAKRKALTPEAPRRIKQQKQVHFLRGTETPHDLGDGFFFAGNDKGSRLFQCTDQINDPVQRRPKVNAEDRGVDDSD